MSIDVTLRQRLGDFELDVAFRSDAPVLALFGRSGCGKSSIVNAIAGASTPDEGRIEIDGRVLFDRAARIDLPSRRRQVGYVFQDSLLFPHLSVRSNLLYGCRRTQAQAQVGQELSRVTSMLGIEALLARRPSTLSGGERQRVAIGRALLARPRLLLLDEPLASLDRGRRSEIMGYLEQLRDGFDVPMVFVSHSVDEVARLSDALVLLSEGRVVAQGPTQQMLNRLDLRPWLGESAVGALLETRLREIDARDGLGRFEFDGGRILAPVAADAVVGSKARLRIPARDVSLALTRPEGTSVTNLIDGVVAEVFDDGGPGIDVRLAVGSQALIARITRQSMRALDVQPGRSMVAMVKSIALDRRTDD